MGKDTGSRIEDELVYSLGGQVFKELDVLITYYEARVGDIPELADICYNAIFVGHINVDRLAAGIRRKRKQT